MAGPDHATAGEIISFGPFRLSVAERLLVKGDQPVTLGSRALDILITLVEHAGEVVSRRDLMKRAWPDVIVEKVNLRVHVSNLRKSLNDGQDGVRYIINVAGRGYCFVAPVQHVAVEPAALPASSPTVSASVGRVRRQNLPVRLARIIGRDETVADLLSLLKSNRLVSVVGPGGMGKTTVAVAAARALVDDFDDEVFFIDLGMLTGASLVTTAVASALGCIVQAQDPVPGLLAFLADKRALLVFDNCEHVIEAVTELTERLLIDAPLVHLLATTREALRVEGENIYLLPPLEGPPSGIDLAAVQALASPAVQLFMDRAAASGHRLRLSDADAPIVADICRQADGMALAIELAASRVGAYGIRGTANLLDSSIKQHLQGRRRALPRHQTLQAMLDWSYNLLSDYEQSVLCRLSVFIGIFTLDAAQSVACEPDDALELTDAVASLVDKSLIWTSEVDGSAYYRLLDTTRAYAAVKLADTAEEYAVRRRHARYYANYLKTRVIGGLDFGGLTMPDFSAHTGNVRAALEWSFSKSGDKAVGIQLATHAAPLFLCQSLLIECQRWCERALEALDKSELGTKKELALQEALAVSSVYLSDNGDRVRAIVERGLYLAKTLCDHQHEFNLLAGLNIFLTRTGDFGGALAAAERCALIAKEIASPTGMMMIEWMLGMTFHLAGNQTAAQEHCELGLRLAASRSSDIQFDYFGYDQRVRGRAALGRALWLRGFPDQAVSMAQQAIDEATSRGQPVTISISLMCGSRVSLWCGDIGGAEEITERLIRHAAKYAFVPYHAFGLGQKAAVMIARGKAAQGVSLLQEMGAALRVEQGPRLAAVCATALAEGLARSGRGDEAATIIADAVRQGKMGNDRFDLPELLRIQGEILMAGDPPDLSGAEAVLLSSIDWARKQSALGWELRSATTLARLWAAQGRGSPARKMLRDIYQQFTEGFGTTDLKAAHHLLNELSGS